jgi:CBS-domain-containing membrane protein
MKLNPAHVLTRKWTQLAGDIEQSFFHIERERRVLAAVINGSIAGGAVALVAWMVTQFQAGDVLLFACLGSSASSLVFAPLSRHNSLRTIMLAYLIASLVCVALFPVHRYELAPLPLQFFLAVAVPIAVMRLVDCMHPAAIGSALAFLIYERDLLSLMQLLLAILGLLTIVKILAYIYLEELEFRYFSREFGRDYYGQEVTVTVVSGDEHAESVPQGSRHARSGSSPPGSSEQI